MFSMLFLKLSLSPRLDEDFWNERRDNPRLYLTRLFIKVSPSVSVIPILQSCFQVGLLPIPKSFSWPCLPASLLVGIAGKWTGERCPKKVTVLFVLFFNAFSFF